MVDTIGLANCLKVFFTIYFSTISVVESVSCKGNRLGVKRKFGRDEVGTLSNGTELFR